MNSKEIYIPILKWKKGEAEALKNLYDNHKQKIVPLLEITDYIAPELIYQDIQDYYPYNVYIDTLIAAEDDRDYLISIVSEFYNKGHVCFPVLYYEDLSDIAEKILDVSNRIAIKIPVPEDIDGPNTSEILDAIKSLKINRKFDVDIMLDLGIVEKKEHANIKYSELKSILSLCSSIDYINRIIIISTSFPEDISSIPPGGTSSYERYDFKIFKKAFNEYVNLKNKLVYSDYGVTKFTDTDIDFSLIGNKILPKVRYTTDNAYIIFKGKKDKLNKNNNITYKDIAIKIINSDFYYGKDFSFGDMEINERANSLNKKGTGNHKNWVTISANHHIAVVVERLSTFLGV